MHRPWVSSTPHRLGNVCTGAAPLTTAPSHCESATQCEGWRRLTTALACSTMLGAPSNSTGRCNLSGLRLRFPVNPAGGTPGSLPSIGLGPVSGGLAVSAPGAELSLPLQGSDMEMMEQISNDLVRPVEPRQSSFAHCRSSSSGLATFGSCLQMYMGRCFTQRWALEVEMLTLLPWCVQSHGTGIDPHLRSSGLGHILAEAEAASHAAAQAAAAAATPPHSPHHMLSSPHHMPASPYAMPASPHQLQQQSQQQQQQATQQQQSGDYSASIAGSMQQQQQQQSGGTGLSTGNGMPHMPSMDAPGMGSMDAAALLQVNAHP